MTELGVRMIAEMNAAGILIDLAHSNDPCALDIIEVSTKPVVDSHSGPRALVDEPRAAPDEVMRALAERGGVLESRRRSPDRRETRPIRRSRPNSWSRPWCRCATPLM